MGSGEGTPGRRLRLVLARPRSQTPEAPRVEALDALLREVDDLRLTLETDLTLAASAVESGHTQLAADILGGDRAALHSFEDHALDHLAELDAAPKRHRPWAQAHGAPFVAAAALVGVLAGIVPQMVGPRTHSSAPQTVAASSLLRLQQFVEIGDTHEAREASAQLHRQLASAVANAHSDPEAAENALLLLSYEQSAIARSGDSGALADVMRTSQALTAAIVAALPRRARLEVPRLVTEAASPSASPKPKPSASSTPAPKATPSPTVSPTASPSASASPRSSSSSSSSPNPNPLPSPPAAP